MLGHRGLFLSSKTGELVFYGVLSAPAGAYKGGLVAVTIHDVAKEAKVSISTVSRVMNDLHTGDPAIRERVLQAARELGYPVRGSAPRMAISDSMRFVISPLEQLGGYYGDILQGAEEEARKYNYDLYFSTLHRTLGALGSQSGSPRITEGNIHGMIYTGGSVSPKLLREFKAFGVPFVVVNTYIPGARIESVMCDNFQSVYKAVTWLIGLGHRRIACISCGTQGSASVDERVNGYRSALDDADLSFEGDLVWAKGFTTEDGREAMEPLLRLSERPTAVFGVVDEVVVGAMKRVKESGLRVPEDISFVGMNDLEIAQHTEPPLTTVRIPRREMGRVAVRRLLDLIRDPNKVRTRTDVVCEFVVRESCGRSE